MNPKCDALVAGAGYPACIKETSLYYFSSIGGKDQYHARCQEHRMHVGDGWACMEISYEEFNIGIVMET